MTKKVKKVLIFLTSLLMLSVPQVVNAQKYSKADITCLAKNAYFESRGDGDKGILAVIFVVLNRTKDPRFPSSPCRVISQPNQFEWVGKGKVVKDHETYSSIEKMVKDVVSGKYKDVTNGSTHFHNNRVKPSWCRKMTPTVRIGGHRFYK